MRSKKITALLFSAVLLSLSTGLSDAEPLSGFDAGIENIASYQEVVFLPATGDKVLQPITLKGTVKGPKKAVDKEKSPRKESYTYTLTGKDASLKRTITLQTVLERSGQQVVEKSEVTAFKEVITIRGTTYTADQKSSQFTQSVIHQKKPAVDYFSGNMSYMKTYTSSDKSLPPIIVSMEGNMVGYDQFWGTTETRTMNYHISTESQNGRGLNGTYQVKSANNITKDIEYIENQPSQISFRGGYMISMKDESVLQYHYDINGYRGENSMTLANNPVFERLYIPAYKDISGHWAEQSIGLMASLKAINPDTRYFSPSTPISREEFAKAVAVVSHLMPKDLPKRNAAKKTDNIDAEVDFVDLPKEKTYNRKKVDKKAALAYTSSDYIRQAAAQGVLDGVGEHRFDPNGNLSRAQAAQILINALGFQLLAPNGNFATGYVDDEEIPFWARDSVYLASEIGIMQGSENNYFQPDRALTRAEAASILESYIRYLTYELREEYRERIMNY